MTYILGLQLLLPSLASLPFEAPPLTSTSLPVARPAAPKAPADDDCGCAWGAEGGRFGNPRANVSVAGASVPAGDVANHTAKATQVPVEPTLR